MISTVNKKIFFILFILIISSSIVYGVGIGEFKNKKLIQFEPGKEEELRFQLFDSPRIRASLEGDLAEYCTLVDPSPDGGSRTISIRLKLPEYLEPGEHKVYLVATEASESGATLGGIASVRSGITVFALYPAKHPIFKSVSTTDFNINEKGNLGLNVINYGEDTIENLYGTITIYDGEGNEITVLKTESKSVNSFEEVISTATLDSSIYNLTPGKYTAKGNIIYDDVKYPDTLEATFRIGQMKVDIIDSTKEVFINSTNKYIITIESDWAGNINDVYARITTPNGKSLKTPNVDMISPGNGRKAAAQIETYWETNGLTTGSYDMDITLYYQGLTTNKIVKVDIIEGKAPEIEKPKSLELNITYILIASIIIVIFVVAYFFIFRKGTDKVQSDNVSRQEEPTNSNDDEIKPPSL